MFSAQIILQPSFHDNHTWSLTLKNEIVQIRGTTDKASVEVEKRLAEYDEPSRRLFAETYAPTAPSGFGMDGITVTFTVESATSRCHVSIWSPRPDADFPFSSLLKLCWFSLYGHDRTYDKSLELIYGYFDWGVPAFRLGSKLKVFGRLSSLNKQALQKAFEDLNGAAGAIIDMTNFEGMGTLLLPILKGFAQNNPDAKWLANEAASKHLDAAGIAYIRG